MIKAQNKEKNRKSSFMHLCLRITLASWLKALAVIVALVPAWALAVSNLQLCKLFFLLFRVKKILFRMGISTILHFEICLVLRGTLKESEYIQEPQEIWGQQFWWMNTKNRPLFCCFHFSLVFTRTLAVRPLKIIRTGLKIAEAWIWFKWEPSVTRSKSGSLLRWWIGFHIQYLERELFVSTAGAL